MLTDELIEHILSTIPHRTVGLVGDLFLDRYLHIDPALDEPSIETGKTAYQVTSVRSQPGALGTVVNNLVALGVGRVVPISVVGDDGEGYELRQALAKLPGVELDAIVTAADRRTPTYTKPMYAADELNRLDIKNRTPLSAAVERYVTEVLYARWTRFDAVLVLDQVSEANCGVVTDAVRRHVAELAAADPAKFVLADSRERITKFRHVCVKPNEREVTLSDEELAKLKDTFFAEYASKEAMQRAVLGEHYEFVMTTPACFMTRGAGGIALTTRDRQGGSRIVNIPAYPVAGPIDVVGAGDSCSAGIACGMVAGCTPEQAAAFGNLVASITVQQIGTTGTASPAQVRARWAEVRAA